MSLPALADRRLSLDAGCALCVAGWSDRSTGGNFGRCGVALIGVPESLCGVSKNVAVPHLQKTFACDHPVALVTGSGAPRVGRVIAEHLASLGCRIVLHANSSTAEAQQIAARLRERYQEALVVSGDVQESEAVDAMVKQATDTFGRIDILVNSAAIWSPLPLEQVTAEELRRYFDVNAVGSFLMAKAVGLVMVRQSSGGAIVNISDWATTRPYLDHAAYFPSKGAVEAMTRSLAVELGRRNHRVRVNCIQPGPVLLGADVEDDKRERITSSMLVGRIGTPEQVAHAAQFLCENEFVTGVVLPVDGGRSIYADDGLQDGLNTG